jgi:acyl-CoA synthetase (AMP-forming)/AMP-acid ligase II
VTRRADTLSRLLHSRAACSPDAVAYRFLSGASVTEITYGGLERDARAIAKALLAVTRPGDRALLVYPPGLEFISAFFGCLLAGVIAVPLAAPIGNQLGRQLPTLRAIAEDARPEILLTVIGLSASSLAEGLGPLRVMTTDDQPDGETELSAVAPEAVAFLQYTSGSTGSPKGVKVTHHNLIANLEAIRRCNAAGGGEGVSWLPHHHDMGLIGGILLPLYESQRKRLDLGEWRVAFIGSEPISADVLDRFVEAFAPVGFRQEAFVPCYGLAEATLLVSGSPPGKPPTIRGFDSAALSEGRVELSSGAAMRQLVGCGAVPAGIDVVIADQAGTIASQGQSGEILIRGATVSEGYWGERDTSPFGHRASDGHTYLRTGDLGFLHDGELFVCGRLKDVIIVRGKNHDPRDIEVTAERCHDAVRAGCVVAFSVAAGGAEVLVVIAELDPRARAPREEVAKAIRTAVTRQHDLRVADALIAKVGTIPKTTSGKLKRGAARAMYEQGLVPEHAS